MFRSNEYINWDTGEKVTPEKDRRLTKAQAKKLAEVMAGFRIIDSVMISDGGCLVLPKGYASVAFMGGGLMGIDPDGRAST